MFVYNTQRGLAFWINFAFVLNLENIVYIQFSLRFGYYIQRARARVCVCVCVCARARVGQLGIKSIELKRMHRHLKSMIGEQLDEKNRGVDDCNIVEVE